MTAEEALAYVRRSPLAPNPDVLQAHLDDCGRCRVVLAEAVRASDGGAEQRAPGPLRTLADGERFLGRYEIRRFIARGGMGEVYEAFDSVLKETVALKTLLPTGLDDQGAVDRVLAEVRLARQVTHPNVCRILEFGLFRSPGDSGTEIPFLTMELLAGEPLARRLGRAGRLPPATVAKLMTEMAAGLGAIHAAGIVHRDLKSENIFLVPDGKGGERPVVTDFGLARRPNEAITHRSSSGAAGTPDYMAPEQIEGKRPTPSFDVYALGVVGFEMLTGCRPFREASPYLSALRRLTDPAPPPSALVADLPPLWDAVIGRCLERQPERRFARVEDVAQALEPLRRPDAGSSSAPRRRGPAVAAALGIGMLAAGAVALFVAQVIGHDRPAASDQARQSPEQARAAGAAPNSAPVGLPGAVVGQAPAPEVPVAADAASWATGEAGPARPPEPKLRRSQPKKKSPGASLAARHEPATVRPVISPASTVAATAEPPPAPTPILQHAETLMLEGEVAGACALGEQAVNKMSAPAPAHLFLGRCYVRLGKPALARQHYQRYVELAPDAPDLAFVRGILDAVK